MVWGCGGLSGRESRAEVLVAGAGSGGLAAGIACARQGHMVRVFEQSGAFAPVGAGIQLGPNATRILEAWGLLDELLAVACVPQNLVVRSVQTGRVLARKALGESSLATYGAPYVCVHRADLHRVLLEGFSQLSDVSIRAGRSVVSVDDTPVEGVCVQVGDDPPVQGDVLVGADGLWSRTREALLGSAAPAPTGHVAYRAMVPCADMQPEARSQDVTVWLGPAVHVVQYPVRSGEAMNVVVVAHAAFQGQAQWWDNATPAFEVKNALGNTCKMLSDLIASVPDERSIDHPDGWLAWQLFERAPVSGPDDMAMGRVALLGDAAHPMRPYLAQGAGMAIEDAHELGRVLAMPALSVPQQLRTYAVNRWQRNAKVQMRAQRNGDIFHASGVTRVARNAAMWALGGRLLDQPWLYGYGLRTTLSGK
jgi:salicylate hydroxylase